MARVSRTIGMLLGEAETITSRTINCICSFSLLMLRFLPPSPKCPDLEDSLYSSGSWVLRPVRATSWILIQGMRLAWV